MVTPKPPSQALLAELRRRAEGTLAANAGTPETPLTAGEASRLIHELQVHQVELVMQHEELLRVQEETEAARAQYFDLFDQAPIGYLTLDQAGVLLEINRAAAALLGEAGRSTLGQPLSSRVHPEDQDVLYRQHRELLRTGEPRTWELRLLRLGAPPSWVRMQATVVGTGADPRTLRVAVTDLTEARRRDAKLRRLASAVEHAATSVMITDADGLIQYVNPAFEACTGYPSDQVLGHTPRMLKSGLQGDGLYRELWASITAGKVWHGRLINRNRAGALYTGDTAIAPIKDEQGMVQSYVATSRDVTAELALQQQLQESLKLESIGRLAGGVAHDFNNLLAVVLLSAEELLLEPGPPPELVRELALEMRDASVRAGDLTRQLLAYARKQVFSPEAVDLRQVLTGSEKLLRRILGEDVLLELRLAPGVWPVFCDRSQLEQVILNLAVNARDAMPRGGRLTLTTSVLPAGRAVGSAYPGLAPGDYATLEVTDTGTGMPPEVVARVFDPFFTTKRAGRGTGLGLATVQGIVTQSGGAIRCDSEPGRGTTFSLCLPRATAVPAPAVVSAPEVPLRRGTETLLLVEDDPHVRRAAQRALEGGGYRVLVASDGQVALELAERTGFSLVVTDVIMPGLDGASLVAQLRCRQPALRALFISGYTDDAISARGILRQGTGFLPKPFTGEELLARVRGVLDEPEGAAPREAGASPRSRPEQGSDLAPPPA